MKKAIGYLSKCSDGWSGIVEPIINPRDESYSVYGYKYKQCAINRCKEMAYLLDWNVKRWVGE